MDMRQWAKDLPASHKPLPILCFPAVSLTGKTVYDLTHDAAAQAEAVAAVARRTDASAAVCAMDLSVEAEAFGAEVTAEENNVPAVQDALLLDEDDADSLRVPSVGDGRTGLFIEAAKMAKAAVTDRPVFAGIIGPFSLTGRLMSVSEALMNCIAEPDFTEKTLMKATDFLTAYAAAYKAAGLDGIILAEPLAGLLSPELEKTFSAPFAKRIIDEVQDDSFAVIFHNCGPNVTKTAASLLSLGAAAYHFGDAVELADMLELMPGTVPVLGNISPGRCFADGTPDAMREETRKLLGRCAGFPGFVLSSGCDIPPLAGWDNIDAFFEANRAFYGKE